MVLEVLRVAAMGSALCCGLLSQLQVMPSPCYGGAYDRLRDRMVAISGGTTWVFDGTTMQQIISSPAPSDGIVAYDERRQVVVAVENVTRMTWEWDGLRWRSIALWPFSWPWPFQWPYFSPQITYHAGRGRIVSITRSVVVNELELIEWDGNSWISIPTVGSPPFRPNGTNQYTYGPMAYDRRLGKLVIFGRTERNSAGVVVATLPLCWEWDEPVGWVLMSTVGSIGATDLMWFDEHRGRLLRYDILPSISPFVSWRRTDGTWGNLQYGPSLGASGDLAGHDPVRNRAYGAWPAGNGYLTDVYPADYVLHAAGCSHPLRPRISLSHTWTRPWIGDTLSVEVSPAAQSVAVLATGFSDQFFGSVPLPVSLSVYGLPGCELRIAPEHIQIAFGAAGTVRFQQAVPYSLGLVGIEFWQQAFTAALGVNPAGILLSDSMRGRIGKPD